MRDPVLRSALEKAPQKCSEHGCQEQRGCLGLSHSESDPGVKSLMQKAAQDHTAQGVPGLGTWGEPSGNRAEVRGWGRQAMNRPRQVLGEGRPRFASTREPPGTSP